MFTITINMMALSLRLTVMGCCPMFSGKFKEKPSDVLSLMVTHLIYDCSDKGTIEDTHPV